MELWERQPGESAKAFHAFTFYRDLGHERSVSKVAQIYRPGRNLRSLMSRWSTKYSWVKRAEAYGDHLDELRRKRNEKEIQVMEKRHITLSMSLQQKAAEKLKDLKGKDMKVPEAIKALVEGAKLERLTRGEPTEKMKGELHTIITKSEAMPWENIPEVAEAVAKIREKLRKEKEAAERKQPA